MALDHTKMRRILDRYYRVPGRSITRQWDSSEDLQAFFDEQGITNCTAADVLSKEAEYDAIQTAHEALVPVLQARRDTYPPIGDQLDAIMKQMNQDRLGGKELIQQADDWVNDCLAVKAAHPKPE